MALLLNSPKSKTERVFSDDQIVQILALDGGGLKGLFSASVIEGLESHLGHSITQHFDIITGTSTGGLIALALSRDKSGKDIVRFYQEDGPRIFPNSFCQKSWRYFAHWLFTKYSNRTLRKTVDSLLKESSDSAAPLLLDSNKRLIIPTFLASNSQPRLLKTPHSARYRNDWKLPMSAIALATSAAPTYLPTFTHDHITYMDGGLWANNPSLCGVIEAMEMGAKRENIRVLNITTTSSSSDCLAFKLPIPFFTIKVPSRRLGKIPWASKILPLVMEANSYATNRMYLFQLLAEGNLAVIDEQLNVGHADLDSIDYTEFYARGKSAAEHATRGLKAFFEHIASPYSPNPEAIATR